MDSAAHVTHRQRGENPAALGHLLIFEEVLANGSARGLARDGTTWALGIRLPGFLRATGRSVVGTAASAEEGLQ